MAGKPGTPKKKRARTFLTKDYQAAMRILARQVLKTNPEVKLPELETLKEAKAQYLAVYFLKEVKNEQQGMLFSE